MFEQICTNACHQLFTADLFDLVIFILGIIIGQAKNWKREVTVALFIVRVFKWWMETHPHGKEIAQKTDANEQIHKLFGIDLQKIEAQEKEQFDKK
jgi:hypothetical protein